jgi:hypothetical protein
MQVMQSITAREMNQGKRQELMINAGRTDQNTRTIENSSPRRQANQKWLRQKGNRETRKVYDQRVFNRVKAASQEYRELLGQRDQVE